MDAQSTSGVGQSQPVLDPGHDRAPQLGRQVGVAAPGWGIVEVGGPAGLIDSLPAQHFTFTGSWTWTAFIGVFLALLLGETLVPPYTQRAFAARDPQASRRGYLVAGIFSFGFFFVTATIGLLAMVLFPDIAADQPLPTVVANLLPVGVTGLVHAALLAVIMSTADSCLTPLLSCSSRTSPCRSSARRRPIASA